MTAPRSIQGERALEIAQTQYADQAYVEEMARTVSDDLAICRGRGRHNYPALSRTRMNFEPRDEDELLERRTDWCTDCKCVRQVQVYEPYEMRQGNRRIKQVRKLFTYPEYRLHPKTGEQYLTKGHGRTTPKAFTEAVINQALVIDQEAHEMVTNALRKQRQMERGK